MNIKNIVWFIKAKIIRRNPSEVRLTSGQKRFTAIIKVLLLLQNSVRQILKFIRSTWNYWWNETDGEILHSISKLRHLFSKVSMGSYFQCYLYLWLLEKCKKDCNILKIILIQGFCPLKTEVARFPIGFWKRLFFLVREYFCNYNHRVLEPSS